MFKINGKKVAEFNDNPIHLLFYSAPKKIEGISELGISIFGNTYIAKEDNPFASSGIYSGTIYQKEDKIENIWLKRTLFLFRMLVVSFLFFLLPFWKGDKILLKRVQVMKMLIK